MENEWITENKGSQTQKQHLLEIDIITAASQEINHILMLVLFNKFL